MSSSSSVSSTSSYLDSLARTWNQQLISRDRQIAHEESREAITHDSISSLPYDKPLIDPCGHTFDKETIKLFKKLSTNTVECPVSRRAVRIDQFVPNIYAENVLGYFGEEARRAPDPIHANRVCHCQVCTAAQATNTVQATTTTLAGSTSSDPALSMVLERLEKMQATIDKIGTKSDIQFRQIRNLCNMNCCDHIKALLPCHNHMQTVRDRGLTPAEKKMVNS